MLDSSIKEQLTNTFSRLENPVSFLVSQSSHQAQFELVNAISSDSFYGLSSVEHFGSQLLDRDSSSNALSKL